MAKSIKEMPPFNPTDQPNQYHLPVLLQEAIEGLRIQSNGIYVDCTFGGGGHSGKILEKLTADGKLIAFDQDEAAKRNLTGDPRMIFVQQNFRHLQRFLRLHDIRQVDGIIADIGVSSHQLDEADRGFSTKSSADLDMRMDRNQRLTAFDIVNTYTEQQLHKLFEQYGEVSNARTLARTIVATRSAVSLRTVDNFKNALREMVKGNPQKYFAQVFQALRIEVNDELGALKEMLQQVPALLRPGGRIVVITFHSLEDRIVKNFFRRGSFDDTTENPFINTETLNELRVITRKPVMAGPDEVKRNPRSRSAKMRIAEKL
jgi:16S rRNA (cytosine1402-N4)-methyltransferase